MNSLLGGDKNAWNLCADRVVGAGVLGIGRAHSSLSLAEKLTEEFTKVLAFSFNILSTTGLVKFSQRLSVKKKKCFVKGWKA